MIFPDAGRRQHSSSISFSSPPSHTIFAHPAHLDASALNTPFDLRLSLLDQDSSDTTTIADSSSSPSSSSSSIAAPDVDFWMSTPDLQFQDAFDWTQTEPLFSFCPPADNDNNINTTTSSSGDYYSYPDQTANKAWQQQQSFGDAFSFHQPSPQPQYRQRNHRRALSNSTIASQNSTSSPQSAALQQRHLLDPHHHPQFKHQYYPTPIGTPTRDTFFMEQQGYGGRGGRPQMPMAMPTSQQQQQLPQHHTSAPGGIVPYSQYPPALRTSGSQLQSYYAPGYPNTPTSATSAYGGDARFNSQSNGEIASYGASQFDVSYRNPLVMPKVPRLEPTMTQACADELYSPNMIAPPHQPHQQLQPNANLLTPSVHERLQAANEARQSKSPIDGMKREPSPYREGSYLQTETGYGRPQDMPVNTAAQQRAQQKWHDDQYQHWRHHHRGTDPQQQPQTISPKDAYVDDFHDPAEDSNATPLFPERSNSSQQQQQQQQQAFDESTYRSYAPINGSTATRFPSSSFSFAAPTIPATSSLPSHPSMASHMGGPDFKFAPVALNRQDTSSDDTPAHLISMETSKSEQESSQEQQPQRQPQQQQQQQQHQHQHQQQQQGPPKPQHRPSAVPRGSGSISAADTGTYSCTYGGCPQRFATPALLQKHKRDAHRPTGSATSASRQGSTPAAASAPSSNAQQAGPSTPRSSSSSSATNAPSQAGPHRCDRINPSTGKPCNTVFSRPYDLTRHEDTIHARRPKAHCQHCAERGEEKTFSRADALTRHLRVVHPEVEVFGKLGRRRGL